MLELSLRIEKKLNACVNILSELVKLIFMTVYEPLYEPFQTKAFIEPELSNVNPALMNMSLTLEII